MPRSGTRSSSQLAFGDFAAQRPTDRLFFAVFPDAGAAGRIVAVAQTLHAEHGLSGKPLRVERVHITLHHLGDHAGLPQSIVDVANEAAARVTSPPFDVTFDSASSFAGPPRNRPLVLRGGAGLGGLIDLQCELGEKMKASGLTRFVERAFTPHVTLLYDDSMLPPEPVEPIAWHVREFVLVHSLLGRTEHRILGRWALR